MTEYTTPLTDAQQEISDLLTAVKDAVFDLRELEKALRTVGLIAAADEIEIATKELDFRFQPVAVRFIKSEI